MVCFVLLIDEAEKMKGGGDEVNWRERERWKGGF
jgi:hypothetical protein